MERLRPAAREPSDSSRSERGWGPATLRENGAPAAAASGESASRAAAARGRGAPRALSKDALKISQRYPGFRDEQLFVKIHREPVGHSGEEVAGRLVHTVGFHGFPVEEFS